MLRAHCINLLDGPLWHVDGVTALVDGEMPVVEPADTSAAAASTSAAAAKPVSTQELLTQKAASWSQCPMHPGCMLASGHSGLCLIDESELIGGSRTRPAAAAAKAAAAAPAPRAAIPPFRKAPAAAARPAPPQPPPQQVAPSPPPPPPPPPAAPPPPQAAASSSAVVPKTPSQHLEDGNRLSREKAFAAALESYNASLLPQDPPFRDRALIYRNRCFCLFSLKRYDEAIADAEEAIRLEPNKKGATIHWRIVQSLQKKAEAAKAAGSEHDHYKFLEMAKAAAGKALAHKASMPAASQAEWQADKSFQKIEQAHACQLPPPPAAVEAASGEGEAGPSRLKSDASAAEGAGSASNASVGPTAKDGEGGSRGRGEGRAGAGRREGRAASRLV